MINTEISLKLEIYFFDQSMMTMIKTEVVFKFIPLKDYKLFVLLGDTF